MSWELVPDSAGPGRSSRGGAGASGSGSRSPRWLLLLVGVLVALLGASLLAWPFFAASRILAFLVGGALIANGIAALVGIRARGIGGPAAVLLIVAGAVAILFPAFTVSVLVGFVGMLMIGVGVIWLLIAIRLRPAVGSLSVVLPAILIALGLAGLIWPAFALTLAALAAGLVTLLIGVSLVWGVLALRHRGE